VFLVYATSLAVGGTLLLASLLLGHHGADHGAEVSVPHFDGHGHTDGGADGDNDFGLGVTFLSMRFWTFTLAFFGLTGVLFDKLELASSNATAALAVGMGVGTGFVVSWTVNRLKRQVVNSLPSEVGYAGLTGEMLLEASADESGRIRIVARGSTIDLPARPQNRERLAKGTRALVVDVTDGVACVAPAPETGAGAAQKNERQNA
jgi:hypothetical protein